MQLLKSHKIATLLFIFFVIVLAFWQVAFLQASLKWDNIDVVLPFRYFAGNNFSNGALPLWNPYILIGSPFYADLQCPTWYPETILVGTMFGYSNITIQFLFIFYLLLAAFGGYRMVLYLTNNRQTALSLGIVYALSGYMVGHGQALFAIIGAAWLPYSLLSYLRLQENGKVVNLIVFSITTWFMVMGGYQTTSIIYAYCLMIVFFVVCFRFWNNKKRLLQWIFYNTIALIIICLLSFPVILSTVQTWQIIERFVGMTLQSANFMPFSPQSLISLILPFSTVAQTEFFNTDLSLRNIYLGFPVLLFFIQFLFQPKNKISYLVLFLGFVFLTASMGEYTPVREFLYNYFPLLNKFRLPAYFNLFFLISVLYGAALGLADFYTNGKKKIVVISGYVLLGVFVIALFISFYKHNFSFQNIFKEIKPEFSFYRNIFIQSCVQIGMLSIFIILLKMKQQKTFFITGIIVLDMLIATQFNINHTVIEKANPLEIQAIIENQPEKFLPPINKNISYSTKNNHLENILWRNVSIFKKETVHSGFSSFIIQNFNNYTETNLGETLNNPVFFLTNNIFPESFYNKVEIKNNTVFIADSIYEKYKIEDSQNSNFVAPEILEFSPSGYVLKIDNKEDAMLNIIQAYTPFWNATLNGKSVEVLKTNFFTQGIFLPKGENLLSMKFQPPYFNLSLIVSYTTFFVLLLVLFLIFKKEKNKKKTVAISIFGVLVFLIFPVSFLFKKNIYNEGILHKTVLLESTRNFDSDSLNSSNNQSIVLLPNTQNLVQQMDSLHIYSAAFQINSVIKETDFYDFDINFHYFADSCFTAKIVLEIKNNGEQIHWQAFDFEGNKTNEKPNSFSTNFRSPFKLSPENEIIIYVWNDKAAKFFIDDFVLKIYSWKTVISD